MQMPQTTLLVAALLVALGLGTYTATGGSSFTALIPAILGAVLALLGFVGLRGGAARRHAMHGVAVVALLGILGSLRAVPSLVALLSGGLVERPVAVIAQVLTIVLCGVLLALAVQSFVRARRSRA